MRIDIRPTPSDQLNGLKATSGPLMIGLMWNMPPISPTYSGAQVFVNTVNDFETATMYATVANNAFDYPTSDASTRYFWIRAVDGYGRATGPITGPASAAGSLVNSASLGVMDLATLKIVNQLSSGSISGLGALATLSAVDVTQVNNLGRLATANRIYADDIGAGQLAAGVIYVGTLNASQIKTGSLVSIGIQAGSGAEFSVNGATGAVFANIMTIYGLKTTDASGTAGSGATSARSSRSGNPGISAYASAGHGVEGQGGSGKFAFYAYGAGGYGPFTGSHDVVWKKEHGQIGEIGDIVIDHECIAKDGVSNTLFEVQVSTRPNQKGAIGVLNSLGFNMSETNVPAVFVKGEDEFEANEQTHHYKIIDSNYADVEPNYIHSCVNSLGEGQINVCGENGNLERGDLIVTSSMPGKGMRQDDDIVRGYTVAKVREAVVFDAPDQVKMVACIYLCG